MTRIYLFKRGRIFHMKWMIDQKWYRQTTGQTTKAKAKDIAAKKQIELSRQQVLRKEGINVFKLRYLDEKLAGLTRKHQNKFKGAIAKLVEFEDPKLVTDIDSVMLASFANKMRDEQLSAHTIHSYLGYIGAALEWAHQVKLINEVPLITKPSLNDDGAVKGRPLTGEEIDRYLAKVEGVVGENAKQSFVDLINGLNLSGLRLSEALKLHWPGGDSTRIIVCVGAHVTLEIPAGSQKKRRRQQYPVTPDFAKWLLSIPSYERVGPVFNPQNLKGQRFERTDTVSKRLSTIGEKAGIIVKHSEAGKKFASAHDFRRTFGLRWSKRVNMFELKELMRHSSIETTRKYYVIQEANNMAASLEERFGDSCEQKTELPKNDVKPI